jgi:hypothetical protein
MTRGETEKNLSLLKRLLSSVESLIMVFKLARSRCLPKKEPFVHVQSIVRSERSIIFRITFCIIPPFK